MKNIKSIINITFLVLLISLSVFAQKKNTSIVQADNHVKSTPAYAELLLRKVELESEIESLLESYTEEFPKVRSAKYELELTKKDLIRLLNENDSSKLTLALGKLLVRKNQLETEFWTLQNQYNKEHPEVKRAQRKVLSFQNAVKEILP